MLASALGKMSLQVKMTAELISACESGDVELVGRALLAGADSHGGDLDEDEDDEPPLHVACRAGHLEVAKLLCAEGRVRVDAEAGDGQTPLHCACLGGKQPVAEWLVESGLSVSVTNDDGWTPLLCAAVNGHGDCVRWLLAQGAPPDAMNNDGKCAADLARLRGFTQLATILDDAMTQASTALRGERRASGVGEGEADGTELPEHMVCPLTKKLMRDPVCTLEGQLFERAAIEGWLETKGAISPITGAPLASTMLIPVPALREEIRAWEETHGGAGRGAEYAKVEYFAERRMMMDPLGLRRPPEVSRG